jgi:hypothetical protein
MTAHRDAELTPKTYKENSQKQLARMQQDAEPVAANRKWLKKAAVCENP